MMRGVKLISMISEEGMRFGSRVLSEWGSLGPGYVGGRERVFARLWAFSGHFFSFLFMA